MAVGGAIREPRRTRVFVCLFGVLFAAEKVGAFPSPLGGTFFRLGMAALQGIAKMPQNQQPESQIGANKNEQKTSATGRPKIAQFNLEIGGPKKEARRTGREKPTELPT